MLLLSKRKEIKKGDPMSKLSKDEMVKNLNKLLEISDLTYYGDHFSNEKKKKYRKRVKEFIQKLEKNEIELEGDD